MTALNSTAVDAMLPMLRNCQPLGQLDGQELELLLQTASVRQLGQGQVLKAEQERDWILYLLYGMVRLEPENRTPQTVEAGTPSAAAPLFDRQPEPVIVEPEGTSLIACIDRALYEQLANRRRLASMDVDEIHITDQASDLLEIIYRAYSEQRLRLPSLPDVAMQVRDAVANPDFGLADVARVLETDPALCVRLIQVANSPAYRGAQPVQSVQEAAGRLGLKSVQSFTMAMAMRDLFHAESEAARQESINLYASSQELASLAFAMARRIPELNPDRALLAGLVRNIGALPIISYCDSHPVLSCDLDSLSNAVQQLKDITGGLVLRHWGFDDEMVALAEGRDYESEEALGYIDVIRAVEVQACRSLYTAGAEDFDSCPSHERIVVAGYGELLECDLRTEAAEEIAVVQRLLAG